LEGRARYTFYTKNKDAQEGLRQPTQDLREGRIGETHYFRAKKHLNQPGRTLYHETDNFKITPIKAKKRINITS